MAILVDTSVWIDHFRGGENSVPLGLLLEEDAVRCHPAVIGELAMGTLAGPRERTLARLDQLARVAPVSDDAVRALVEERRLWGRGIGWTDAHLLASALAHGHRLWTLDARLDAVARDLEIC